MVLWLRQDIKLLLGVPIALISLVVAWQLIALVFKPAEITKEKVGLLFS